MFLLDNLNNMQIVVLGVVGPKMAMDFGSKEVDPKLMRGSFPWIAHAQFLELLKSVPICVLDQKHPCEFA